MLGVTRLPPWFKEALSTFELAFSDSRNVDSFRHLVSALILAETQWTVSGLSEGISRPDGNAKSRRAYDYFFGGANWSATDLAQYHAEYVFDQLQVGANDDILLHIDDTFAGKTGDATDGVARLYNPVAAETELGNKLVTSCLQVGDVYVPYLAQMYVPEDFAPDFDEPFKKRPRSQSRISSRRSSFRLERFSPSFSTPRTTAMKELSLSKIRAMTSFVS